MAIKPISVSQLNNYINRVLSTDPILCNIAVTGEVSNLTKHSSGHWYFALKDDNSKINCFLPSSRIHNLRYDISEGMQITCFGSISVYEKGGYYSLMIRDLEVEGEGNLKIAFENLKIKLEAEGLFDIKYKKSLPKDPKNVGVITSPTGAAIHDIISTIKRRNNTVNVLLYPALVQGENAAKSLTEGLKVFNEKFPDLDLIIIGRGGGSAEDLWSFNEESLARAIFESGIPVISAVGHEVDYVISDYVADVRGATPTAAAEIAVPKLENWKEKLEYYSPINLYSILEDKFDRLEYKLSSLKLAINASNPNNILNKGYALVSDKNDVYISSVKGLNVKDKLSIKLFDGIVQTEVLEIKNEKRKS